VSQPRSVHPPRIVVGAWGLALVLGAVAVVLGPLRHAALAQQGLIPSTVGRALQALPGPDAERVRVNGVYGSAIGGDWQFVAHLTWFDPHHGIQGGVSYLPELDSAAPASSPFGPGRLTEEESFGWTASQLDHAFADLTGLDARYALVELDLVAGVATITSCHAETLIDATCEQVSGGSTRTFHDHLVLNQAEPGPLQIQRADALLP
jgi:hypothetical protein